METKIYSILMRILVIFSCDEMGILTIDLNNINLDDTNYDEDDLKTISHLRLLVLKNAKHLKKDK